MSEPMPSFYVKIHFWGLCLFVPDPASGILYVLMPAAGVPGGAGEMPPHLAMLYADPAYLKPGSAKPVGRLQALGNLEGTQLAFPATTALGDDPLPPQLVNVGVVAKQPLKTCLFGSTPDETLTARITLSSGSCIPPVSDSASPLAQCWIYPRGTQPRPLAHTIVWTITNNTGDSLVLAPTPFAGGPPAAQYTLYPINGGIQIGVYHTDQAELPGAPPQLSPPMGTPAPHFPAYYILFENQHYPEKKPSPISSPCDPGDPNYPKYPNYGNRPYTCMGPAQSALDPT